MYTSHVYVYYAVVHRTVPVLCMHCRSTCTCTCTLYVNPRGCSLKDDCFFVAHKGRVKCKTKFRLHFQDLRVNNNRN